LPKQIEYNVPNSEKTANVAELSRIEEKRKKVTKQDIAEIR